MVRHTVTAIIGLFASLGGTAALAGPGDLDPDYGADGRLTAATIFYDPNIVPTSGLVALNLPDDRLVTVEGTLVRRFDSEGRLDLSFGDNGETAFPLPDATSNFSLLFNPVATPDGGLVIAGLLTDDLGTIEALIRLDRDGDLLTSFGGHGDGVYRLTTEPIPQVCGGICTALMGVAVDPAGRVLLAKRSWNALGRCSGTPRVERLAPDGAIDSTFGANGAADITGVDLCASAFVFGARNDDSIVVGSSGVVFRLDESGARDAAFGAAGQLSLASHIRWTSARLLPDGGLLLAGAYVSPHMRSPLQTVLVKFDASGQRDALFGEGTGAVRQDFGQAFYGMPVLGSRVFAIASTDDGGQLYLQVSVTQPDGEAVCAGGIARLSGDGSIDTSFGQRGLTCLDYGAFPFALIGLKRDGAPLFGQLDGNVYRLLLDASASPGFLTLARSGVTHRVWERRGNTARLSLVRTAGQDGAVSAHFYTREAPPDTRHRPPYTAHIARADLDFRTADGRLEWADGEAGSRSAGVVILEDLDEEIDEVFLVNIDDPQGGTQLYGADQFIIAIVDDDGTAPAGAAPPGDSQSGGGGSIPWYIVAALAAFAARGLGQAPSKRPRKIKNTAASMHKAAQR